MKRYSKLFYALALIPFLALSCQEEEIYQAGEEDNAACYGVFFPEQDGVGAVELDPTDPTEKVIKVSRTKSEGAITVPLDIITSDPEGFWTVSELKFDDGQEDTTIVLSFPNAEIGKAGYGITLQVSDPLYASKYSKNATYISYAPQRVKWNDVLDADGNNESMFTDVLQTLFGGITPTTWKVKVQERDDQKGVYRIIDPYYDWVPLYQAATGDYDPISYGHSTLVINASNPDAVWIPCQCVGLTDLWGYGEICIGSKYAVYMELGDTSEEAIAAGAAPRGKMVNGVITFPKDEICIWMTGYAPLSDGWWYANKFNKFIIPGGIETDYSLEIEAGEPVNGDTELTFTAGADIDTVFFAAYTNTLKTAEIGDAAAAIRMRSISVDTLDIYGKGDTTITVQFDTTGVFTVVAVGYDTAGVAQTTASVEFGYLKKGDEDPVQLYASIDNNPVLVKDSSSLAYSFIGRNITELKFDIVNMATFAAAPMKAVDAVIEDGFELDEEELELVNSTGLTARMKGLIPGTDFVIVWWAFNGYVSDFGYAGPAKTSGDPLPIYSDYTWASFDASLKLTKAEDWEGTYNLYAYETFSNTSGIREYLGKVKIAKGAMPDTTGLYKSEHAILDGTEEFFDVTGLLGPSAKKYGHVDSLKFMLDATSGVPVWFNYDYFMPALEGGNNAKSMCVASNVGKAYSGIDMSYFVPVADGYWALLADEYYTANYGLTFDAIGTYICDDSWAPQAWGMVMWDVLLVNVEKDDNGVAKSNVNFKRHIPFDAMYRNATSFVVNHVESTPQLVKKSASMPKISHKSYETIAYDIPSRPVKMTVSASPKSQPRPLATKGGQIRKQDARVRK